MVDLIIFSVGIVIGCIISFVFTRYGISIISPYNSNDTVYTAEDNKVSNSTDYEPTDDTALDWSSYPFTNHYNDNDSNTTPTDGMEIIGYIDPENDEPN